MGEIAGALTAEEMSLYWLLPGSRNGDVHSHWRGLALIPDFSFSKNHSAGTSSLLCLVPRSS